MLYKSVKFALKELTEEGEFEGLAAVYGNVDLGLDIIEPGAFTKTLKDKGGVVPVLNQHLMNEPIGKGELEDSKKGLIIHGKLVMEVPKARENHALMKAEVLKGLSIGYDTVVSEYDKETDIRRLKELKLWEVSIVTFPMNELATISSVKTIQDLTIDRIVNMIRAGRKAGTEIPEQVMKEIKDFIALVDAQAANEKKDTAPGFHAAVESASRISGLLDRSLFSME